MHKDIGSLKIVKGKKLCCDTTTKVTELGLCELLSYSAILILVDHNRKGLVRETGNWVYMIKLAETVGLPIFPPGTREKSVLAWG